jgi:hypothetical protein
MASDATPSCPDESCDGHLHREFLTGIPQSTAQMMRWGGVALIVVPILFGAPFFIDNVIRGSSGAGGMIVTLVGMVAPIVAGVLLLRHRTKRRAERSEQQRCNKCGGVFPA